MDFQLFDRLPYVEIQTWLQLEACLKNQGYEDFSPKIFEAFELAQQAHQNQFRADGQPYIVHPLTVACLAASLKLDEASLICALLHDVVEDTPVTLDQIRQTFGANVAFLVDGVTKLNKLDFRDRLEFLGENVRKMMVATSQDVRVLLIKLLDRLHNMRTLGALPVAKQQRLAQETLELYAPIAARLGLAPIKMELEDLSFKALYPEKYDQLWKLIFPFEEKFSRLAKQVYESLSSAMDSLKISPVKFQGRLKHLWSIYRKFQTSLAEDTLDIHDLLAFRVIVPETSHCYLVLGIIHELYKPVPGRFKDFIAMPKQNGYQSLHTTVVGPEGLRIEFQIRTFEMHAVAEMGVASHWRYKENLKDYDRRVESAYQWLRQVLESHQNESGVEFLENVKSDLFENEIFVFTPKGEVKSFPEGATVLDFAYAIHTELGHSCTGARVNGRWVSLRHRLTSGDTVEILTSPQQKPSKDWLKYVVTNRAKSKIRAFLREQERLKALEIGKNFFLKEIESLGLKEKDFLEAPLSIQENFFRSLGFHRWEDVWVALGYGRLTLKTLFSRWDPQLLRRWLEQKKENSSFISWLRKMAPPGLVGKSQSRQLVLVEGHDDLLIHLARCCQPVPGESIVGIITRGRGISVHRADCPQVFAAAPERRISVAWSQQAAASQGSPVQVQVVSRDEKGLLKQMAEIFSSLGINIEKAQVRTLASAKAISEFTVRVKNVEQLQKALKSLLKIKGVFEAKRVIHK